MNVWIIYYVIIPFVVIVPVSVSVWFGVLNQRHVQRQKADAMSQQQSLKEVYDIVNSQRTQLLHEQERLKGQVNKLQLRIVELEAEVVRLKSN